MESYFYKKRGCQYPWNSYTDLNVPICKKFPAFRSWFYSDSVRPYFSNGVRNSETQNQCPSPCNFTSYDLKYLINYEAPGKSLKIAFLDLQVEHRTEYLSCDKTCILGEVGGNLGFFLGGSILMFFDILIMQVHGIQHLVRGKPFGKLYDEKFIFLQYYRHQVIYLF